MREAKPGDVLVVDGKGYTERAVAGDFVIGLVKSLESKEWSLTVRFEIFKESENWISLSFARASTISASTKNAKGELQVPLSCGGVSVSPGDLIIGDKMVSLSSQKEKKKKF